ncbi:MAG: hypothetical protein H6Q75_151 [Firmicutes bacterium]|nr:hypothetical protein [Bacillota bacterium]
MRLCFSPLDLRRVRRFQSGRLDTYKWEMTNFDMYEEFGRDYFYQKRI